MTRTATTVSFSLQASDKARFEALVERQGGRNRSELFRHAIELLEREELAHTMSALQALGDQASARARIPQQEAAQRSVAALARFAYRPSPRARELVAALTEGRVDGRPTRTRRPVDPADLPA